jgi:hypothetical protein
MAGAASTAEVELHAQVQTVLQQQLYSRDVSCCVGAAGLW